MADMIATLPVDDTPEVPEDVNLVNRYLAMSAQAEPAGRLFSSNADVILATALFFVLSLPLVDEVVAKAHPRAAESLYYRLGIKSLLFLVLLFIFNNLRYFKPAKAA